MVSRAGQVRLGRLLLGLDLGPEFLPSPMHFAGETGTVNWGAVRFNGGLLLGVILGRPVRPTDHVGHSASVHTGE